MEIRAEQEVKVTIDKYQIKEIILEESKNLSPKDMLYCLRKSYLNSINMRSDAFVRNKMWKYEEEYHTSHSWTEVKDIREVTDNEEYIWTSLYTFSKGIKAYMPSMG